MYKINPENIFKKARCLYPDAPTDHVINIVVVVCKNKGIDLPQPMLANLRSLDNPNIAIDESAYFNMSITAPDMDASRRAGMETRHYSEDEEWPYKDDGGQFQRRLQGKDVDFHTGVTKGVPQFGKNEAVDLLGGAPGNEATLFNSTKHTERRKKEWSHGKRFEMKGDFDDEKEDQETENINNYKSILGTSENKQMTKNKTIGTKLLETLILREFKKHIKESIKRKTMQESLPAAKTWDKADKATDKSDSKINPISAAWSMAKKKKKNEAPTYEEFKEAVDKYYESMGFEKQPQKEGKGCWYSNKNKKAKKNTK